MLILNDTLSKLLSCYTMIKDSCKSLFTEIYLVFYKKNSAGNFMFTVLQTQENIKFTLHSCILNFSTSISIYLWYLISTCCYCYKVQTLLLHDHYIDHYQYIGNNYFRLTSNSKALYNLDAILSIHDIPHMCCVRVNKQIKLCIVTDKKQRSHWIIISYTLRLIVSHSMFFYHFSLLNVSTFCIFQLFYISSLYFSTFKLISVFSQSKRCVIYGNSLAHFYLF